MRFMAFVCDVSMRRRNVCFLLCFSVGGYKIYRRRICDIFVQ
jgi:hypothetical protein